jgi:hypothetical protein
MHYAAELHKRDSQLIIFTSFFDLAMIHLDRDELALAHQ